MPRYRRKEKTVDAEQWFPGKHVEGVQEICHEEDGMTVSSGYGMVGSLRIDPGQYLSWHEGRPVVFGQQIFEGAYELDA